MSNLFCKTLHYIHIPRICIWHFPNTRHRLYTISHTALKKKDKIINKISQITQKKNHFKLFQTLHKKEKKDLHDLHVGLRELPIYHILVQLQVPSVQLQVPSMQSGPSVQLLNVSHAAPSSPSAKHVF